MALLRNASAFLATCARGAARPFGRIRRRGWMLAGIGAGTLAVSTGLVAFAPEPDRRPRAQRVVPVASLVAEVAERVPEVHLYGRIETPHAARVAALVAAPVAELAARAGDRVAAGDVLVYLDETDARFAVRRAEADLAEARADLAALELSAIDDAQVLEHRRELHRLAARKAARHRQLQARGSVSEQALNAVLGEVHDRAIALSRQRGEVAGHAHLLARAEAHVARASTTLAAARATLGRTRIRAPFAGRVTRIEVAPGERVSPGSVVAAMYEDTALEVRVQIPTVHLPVLERALAVGRPPPVRVDFGAERVAGVLDRLAGAVGEGQSGVDGFVRLAAHAAPPVLGRAVALRIALSPVPDAVAVPVQAVYGQRRLFLIEDGVLRGIDVERLGEASRPDGRLELLVRSPELRSGARILASQISRAVTGLRVRDAAAREPDAA